MASMPRQFVKDGKWFCIHCKVFSDSSYAVVTEHEMLEQAQYYKKISQMFEKG